MLLLALTAADDHELALAVAERVRRLQDRCQPVPPFLVDLLGACRFDWSRQEATPLDDDAWMPDAGEVILFTTDEVAHLLTLSPRQVQRLISDGSLESVKIGRSCRVRRDDLLAYVAALPGPAASRGTRLIETRSTVALAPEVRQARSELRAKKGAALGFTGHAAMFNQSTMIGTEPWGFRESIIPGAFGASIASPDQDQLLLADHDPAKPLARQSAGTLRLAEDQVGLAVDADMANTSVARDLVANIECGNVCGMSFGFAVTPGGERWSVDTDGVDHRFLTAVDLYEVSTTAFPAYTGTNADLRSAVEVARSGRPAPQTAARDPVRPSNGSTQREAQARRMRVLAIMCGLTPARSTR